MNKSKLAITIDSIFLSFISSLICYVWLKFYLKNAILITFFSILVFFLVFFVFFYFQNKKYKNLNLSLADKKLSEKCLNFFLFSDDENYNSFLQKLLSAKHIDGFIFENQNNYFYINLRWSVDDKDFFQANKFIQSNEHSKELIFICHNQEEKFLTINKLSPTPFKVFLFNSLFKIMKQKNLLPATYAFKQKTKREKLKSFKNNFLESLSKRKFKEFFFSGLSLIVLSIFLPFSFYYQIFGTFLLILSVICIFVKNNKTIATNSNLEDFLNKD